MKNKFNHPLMSNNFIKDDFKEVKKLLDQHNPILTQGKFVKNFEEKWSKWLGVKYSVFVNSGSSANFLTLQILKLLNKNSKKKEILVPALTWNSDFISIIYAGYKPVPVDIDIETLSVSFEDLKKKITNRTLALFITHAQGFNGFNQSMIDFLKKKKIIILEDVCESHGAKFKNKKLGSIGLISNFSFYYAHHLSTIEGGIICTNNKRIFQYARMMRSHGLLRETKDHKFIESQARIYPKLSKEFIFLINGFNFRNNEIGALIGLNQIKRLNKNIKKRKKNFSIFLKNIDKKKFFSDFKISGNSNYAFPVILLTKSFKKRDRLEHIMRSNKIEFRRGNAGGGNQIRQPYLKNMFKNKDFIKYKNTEHIHHFGYYIGNFPELKENKIKYICKILNSV